MHSVIGVKAEVVTENQIIPEIGSEEYNRIRYPSFGRRTPLWKLSLRREIGLKREGKWVYKKQGNGPHHPAKKSLTDDIMHCIANGIPLKTKSFEYKPLDRSIYLYGKYVGTYGDKNASLDSFTIKHIDTKETRYRLRDFGVELVSIKKKTYWRMIFGEAYYQYLLIIHGGFEGLKNAARQLFPSMILESSKEAEEAEEAEGTSVKTILCELRPELEYPLMVPSNHSQYNIHPRIKKFSHSSFTLSTLLEPVEDEKITPLRPTYYYKDWFEYSLTYILDLKDEEHKKFNLSKLLQSVLKNGRLVKKMYYDTKQIGVEMRDKFVFHMCGHLFTFHLLAKELQIKDKDDRSILYKFEELGISEFFSETGLILKPSCVDELVGVLKEQPSCRMKVYCKENEGYDIIPPILDKERYITPLLGKELLLVF